MTRVSSPFLSTLSLRRATVTGSESQKLILHFYPRSPCGERRLGPGVGGAQQRISIHALLAESDALQQNIPGVDFRFLSTLSLRRATIALFDFPVVPAISIHALLAESDNWRLVMIPSCLYFYPRSPCGERHPSVMQEIAQQHFYPRSPCGERLHTCQYFLAIFEFLSTLSLRRATVLALCSCGGAFISIHALLAESDNCVV